MDVSDCGVTGRRATRFHGVLLDGWLDGTPCEHPRRLLSFSVAAPGGYEAAMVAAHLGASVTVVDRDGLGGAAVLTDCVPGKTLISTSNSLSRIGAPAGWE